MKRNILLLLALTLLLPLARADERVWCLITDVGERVAMSEVLCLVAADDDSTFSVVLTSGTTIANVRRAHFDVDVPTGIAKPGIVTCRDLLQLSNAPAGTAVSIYTLDGKLLQQTTSDEEIRVGDLPAHTYYIIKVGESSFKFRKP